MSSIFIPSYNLARKVIKHFGSPLFLIDKNIILERLFQFRNAFKWKTKLFYAIKANYNPAIIKILKDAGIDGVDTVSPFEVKLAKQIGFKSDQIIFTGNNSTNDELKEVFEEGVLLNLGSLFELQCFGRMFPKTEIAIRLNPGIGAGECAGVITAGKESKFGINENDIPLAKEIIQQYKLKVIGIHCHIGSGFYDTKVFAKAIESILKEALAFKNLQFVDFGGGFGVRYNPHDKPIDLNDFFNAIEIHLKNFSQKNRKEIEIRFEPGKFLVAESTVLLTKVTNIKQEGNVKFVGTDTGFNHLTRPAFYGSYHEIINISKPNAPLEKVTVVGNICESSDVLGKNIKIAKPEEDDILAILTTGAYGASMSSLYNLRPYAPEVLLDGEEIILTRKRLSFAETMAHLGFLYSKWSKL